MMKPALRLSLGAVVLLAAPTTASVRLGADQPSARSPGPARPLGSFEIISPASARVVLEGAGARVIDTRPVAKYLAGHIPGAVHIDDERLRHSTSGAPAVFLPEPELARMFERAGINAEAPVVVYSDGEDPLAATITAYALLKIGHSRVLVLDGGFEAWRGNGDATQEHAEFQATSWDAAPPGEPVSASLEEVRRIVDTDEGVLIDARPAKLYRGEGRGWRRNGHIPRAINVDWKSLVRPDNESLFKPRRDIEKLLEDAGLDSDTPTIVYCGTGREATLLYLYLKGVLRWPRVTLYEGSWTEWSADSSLPISTGDEPYVPVHADGDVLVAGQPTEALLRDLTGQGVSLIINCRTGGEMHAVGFDEAVLARSLGVDYVEIPLGGNEGYEPRDVQALKEALASRPDGKVLLHCATGGRAALLWVAHLATNEGLTLEQAQDRARALGMLRSGALERLLGRPTRSEIKP